jgi:microcystin-dependent protein
MPVPANITDLSTSTSSNSPAGSESARGTIDDYLRAHAKFIADLRDGKVAGPASATDNAVAIYDGTGGKTVKDSTKTLPSGAIVGTSDTQTLTNKTIPTHLPLAGGTMTGDLTLAGAPTNSNHAATKAYVDTASGTSAVLAAVYPVGSIYINATNSTNPGTLLGFGTWTAFGAGRVPVGFSSGDSSFNSSEKTGGSKDAIVVSHTHTASSSSSVSDPGHAHNVTYYQDISNTGGNPQGTSSSTVMSTVATAGASTGISVSTSTTVSSTGSSGTNANLQPYITVYMWKRTA